jgi:ATP-dependent RNA helicase DeaD
MPELLKGIEALGFEELTPVQEKVIPVILETEKDIVALAQTGTGKTAAFGLPVIQNTDISEHTVQTLVLAPTRELCIQITKDLQSFARYLPQLHVVPVYGGASAEVQIRELRRGAHVVVATPGRMLDLIRRRAVDITGVRNVVLDVADEMLNMGFRDELDGILDETPAGRRTLLFSATMQAEVARMAESYMDMPEKITVGRKNAGAENVSHHYHEVSARHRYEALKRLADINSGIYGIVFCRTRRGTRDIAEKLIRDGYNADAIHGDLTQSQRDQVMRRFRNRSLQMLVATDVAARGIDVDDITHIINYNLPDDPEVYTHRSGRTGRAGKSGVSLAIITPREKSRIREVEKIIGKRFEKKNIPTGEEIRKKQLFKLIDRMERAEVDEAQIAPFMEEVYKKLGWMSKEEVIKHFVSLEFNRVLEYYKDAQDLNVTSPKTSGDGRNSEEDFFPGNRRKKGKTVYTRFFISLGKKDGIEPKNIIGLVNDHTGNRDINIGHIDIHDSFAFFEAGREHTVEILTSFHKASFRGREVRVDEASERKEPAKKKNRTKRKKSRFAA